MSQAMHVSCPGWMRRFVLAALALGATAAGHAEVQVMKEHVVPSRIRPYLLVLSAAWSGQVSPDGTVNPPETPDTLYPGQKIALALVAEGPDRDKLLREARLNVRITTAMGAEERTGLKPAAIRRIKAEGADMALAVLKAGGVSEKDRNTLQQASSLVSYAIFEAAWTAPAGGSAETIQLSATVPSDPAVGPIEPVTLKIRPTADWLGETLPTRQETGQFMNRYHEDLPPGRLLLLLKAVAADGTLKAPPVAGFFARAYQSHAAARAAAVALFPTLDPKTQTALLFVLRLGGQDISALPLTLPSGTTDSLQDIAPLKDPRNLPRFQDPVALEAVRGVGDVMDQCWSGWMASGDPSYLRALVGLLEGAPDYPAYQSWVKNKGGAKGLNAAVARGLAYQIAGWSIGSFYRTDPHVADWLLYWENDPALPALLRQEIAALPANPAFRRN